MHEQEVRNRISQYQWYHTIRLTDTVQTPGFEPLRPLTDLILTALRRLPIKGKSVLDIGCRDGLMSIEAERLGAAKVVGIDNDMSVAAVEFLAPFLKSAVQFTEMNLLDLRPETFGLFDAVIFPGVLYHLRYPFWALKLVRDVIKPGGSLLLETAVFVDGAEHALLYCPIGEDSPYEATSCTFFNIKGMVDSLKSLGLHVCHTDYLIPSVKAEESKTNLPLPSKLNLNRAIFT